jgi:hypothetical protein
MLPSHLVLKEVQFLSPSLASIGAHADAHSNILPFLLFIAQIGFLKLPILVFSF